VRNAIAKRPTVQRGTLVRDQQLEYGGDMASTWELNLYALAA